ncbi:MAG: ATP-binding protein [Desulfocapsaceae bacterium]|nr:ATP-binding protein [Desulfocapsaceae bacterium]
MTPNSIVDRKDALEPIYSINGWAGSSSFLRVGVRNQDSLPVVVKIMVNCGTEAGEDSVRRYLQPLMGDDEVVIDILSRGDDLYIVYRAVGHFDGTAMLAKKLTSQLFIHRVELAREAMDIWHKKGLAHGALSLSNFRFDNNWQKAWLIDPDCSFLQDNGYPPHPLQDHRSFIRLFSKLLKFIDDPEGLAIRYLLNLKPYIVSEEKRTSGIVWPSEFLGRNELRSELVQTLRTMENQRIMIVGEAGIGKTTLLEALANDLHQSNAWVVTTRFTKDGDSNSAIVEAFENVGEQLLFSDPLRARREAVSFRKAIGYAVPLVAKVAPSFGKIWQAPNNLLVVDKHNNPKKVLRLALTRLLRKVAEQHQLVILIEDAHLAGRSWHKMLRGLDLEQIPMNIVGFARQTERSEDFKHFKKIRLSGISKKECVELLTAATGIDRKELDHLVNALYDRIKGNPLLLRMTVSALIEKKVLSKNKEGQWQYDGEKVETSLLVSRPDEIIKARLALSHHTRELLMILALLEPPFSIPLVVTATGLSEKKITSFFDELISAQLLKTSGDAIIHETVREELLKNLTNVEKARKYLEIGERLFNSTTVFVGTAKYLARGIERLEASSPEVEKFLPCILQSLEEAVDTGFQENTELYSRIIEQALHSGKISEKLEATVRVIIAQFSISRRNYDHAQQILGDAKNLQPSARTAIGAEQVRLYTLLGKSDKALETGLQALNELGIKISHGSDALKNVESVLEKMQKVLESGVSLESARDDSDYALQKLLASLLPLTYVSKPELFAAIVSQLVSQTLERGVTPDSVRGLTTLGQLACVTFRKPKLGKQLGQMAEKLTKRAGFKKYLPIVCSDLANFILPWSGDLLAVNAINRRGIDAADELGEVQYGGYIRMHDIINRFVGGDRLPKLLRRAKDYTRQVRRDRNALAMTMLEESRRGIQSIVALKQDNHIEIKHHDHSPLPQLIHGLFQAFDSLLRENLPCAESHLREVEENLPSAEGWLAPKVLYFQLKSLFVVRSSGDTGDIYALLTELEEMQLTTQALQPVADYLRCLLSISVKNIWDTIRFAELMLEESGKLGYRALSALCAEEAGRFLALQGYEALAVSFQRRAAKRYHEWGLQWKAASLGYLLPAESGKRAKNHLEGLADWRPGLSGLSTISQIMTFLRDRVGASNVIFAVYKQGVMEMTFELLETTETVKVRKDDFTAVPQQLFKLLNKSMNTGRQVSAKQATAMPLTLGSKRFAVVADGTLPQHLKEALSNGAERLVSAAVLDYVQRHETPSVRSLLQLLMTHLGDSYFLVDGEGNGRDLDGKKFPIPRKVIGATEEVESTGQAKTIHAMWAPPETETGYYRFSGLPTGNIEWLNWDVTCVLWVAKDVSEERLQAKAEAGANEAELVKRLAAGLNHDMNNYLTALSGYFEIMSYKGKIDLSEGSLREAVEGLKAISQRFYHLSQGNVSHLKTESIDLVAAVKGAGRYLRWLVSKDCRFEISVPDKAVRVQADAGALDRILLNLVSNAKQALGTHGKTITIRLLNNDTPVIEVEDDGEGIAADRLKSIFQAGYSGKGSSGLGLHIVKTEAEAMKARISVESTPGVGTVFRIHFSE